MIPQMVSVATKRKIMDKVSDRHNYMAAYGCMPEQRLNIRLSLGWPRGITLFLESLYIAIN
jgi:hypothetical protein